MVFFGQVEGFGRIVKGFFDVAGGQDDLRDFAGCAEQHRQQVGLFLFCRHAGARAGPLGVDDDERGFRHAGQADGFGLQGEPRSAGGGHRPGAGVGCADGHGTGSDFVFGLDGNAAQFGQAFDHVLHDFR